MPFENASGTPMHAPGDAPGWRLPALVTALCIAVLLFTWFSSRAKREERAGAACFQAMFSAPPDLPLAFRVFEKYRALAARRVPASVKDELFRLAGDDEYPLPKDTADELLIESLLFFCLVTEQVFAGAEDESEAVRAALRFVTANVQSGAGAAAPPGVAVGPLHILYRGYATQSAETAWVMAALLRLRGMHAAVVLLPDADRKDAYAIVGVLIDRKLYLFDPYRGVPVCRASDLCIADVESILSGRETLAPGFGGDGAPVTLDRLRNAFYLVPADRSNVTPDAFLLGKILKDNSRFETPCRSFRSDMKNLAAAVFGEGVKVEGSFTRMTAPGRADVVALWDVPFKVDAAMAREDYAMKARDAHRNVFAYWRARQAQLFGRNDAAASLYDEAIKAHEKEPEVVEDAAFFRAVATGDASKKASLLAGYLATYPAGRWRPLATLQLAETEAAQGRKDAALEVAATVKPDSPYALRARLLSEVLRGEKKRVGRFPPGESPGQTTVPAGTK